MCSFDISNMYTNIPTQRITSIIQILLKHHNTQQNTVKVIINITNTVLSCNYFKFNKDCYQQEEGLEMGAPSSAILAEIHLQSIECNNISDILIKHNVIGYFRYVDDKLTDINLTLHEFNNVHPKLLFAMEHEHDNKIDFLNITIQRTENNLTYNIYQKATATDTVIRNSSCHPIQHKMSAISYMINRLNT
jgi:hypothetical protein